MSTITLVGELNPYGSDPRFALYNRPANSAGGRMQRLVAGLHSRTYLRLGRVNLCEGRWSAPAARKRAEELSKSAGGVLVLLGSKVAGAFLLNRYEPFTVMDRENPIWRTQNVVVQLPHPSGRCRLWHEPGAFGRARAVLREAAPDVPWGEALPFPL